MLTGRLRQRVSRCVACVRVVRVGPPVRCVASETDQTPNGNRATQPHPTQTHSTRQKKVTCTTQPPRAQRSRILSSTNQACIRPLSPTNNEDTEDPARTIPNHKNNLNKKCGEVVDIHEGPTKAIRIQILIPSWLSALDKYKHYKSQPRGGEGGEDERRREKMKNEKKNQKSEKKTKKIKKLKKKRKNEKMKK